MRQKLIDKIMRCDSAYQIREVWEEVTAHLKSNEIDMEDFLAIKSAKSDILGRIDAREMHLKHVSFKL